MKQCIAIDIGGTNMKYGRIAQSGEVLSTNELPSATIKASDQLMKTLFSIVDAEMQPEVTAIGIATLGAIDDVKGMVTGACENLPALEGLAMRDILSEKYNLPVSIMNDVNAAAIGEAYFGACKDIQHFFCVALGTGIGGAYILDKKILRGVNGLAGEIGYIHSGINSSYYEEIASVKAFLDKCKNTTNNDLDGRDVFDKALAGEPVYSELFTEWVGDVAKGIIDIIYILDPGTIVIGGGVSAFGERLTKRISAEVEKRLNKAFQNKTQIIPALNGNAANMLGAVSCFL